MDIKGPFIYIFLLLKSQKQYHQDCYNSSQGTSAPSVWRLFEVGTVIGILESSLIMKQEISIWTEAVCMFLADFEPGHLTDSHVQCEQLQGPVLKDPRMLRGSLSLQIKDH